MNKFDNSLLEIRDNKVYYNKILLDITVENISDCYVSGLDPTKIILYFYNNSICDIRDIKIKNILDE